MSEFLPHSTACQLLVRVTIVTLRSENALGCAPGRRRPRPPWPGRRDVVHDEHMLRHGATRLPVPRQRGLVRADLAGQIEALDGRRAVVAALEGARYDRRVVGEAYVAGGHLYVNVALERDWWAARLAGAGIVTVAWPAGCVWVEDMIN